MKTVVYGIIALGITATAVPAATIPTFELISSRTFAGPNIDGACGVPRAASDVGTTSSAVAGGFEDDCGAAARARVGAGYVSALTEQSKSSAYPAGRQGMNASATATWVLDFGITDKYVFEGPERIGVNFSASAALSGLYDDAFRNLFTTAAGATVSGSVRLTGSNNNIDVRSDTDSFSFSATAGRSTVNPDADADTFATNDALSVAVLADPRRPITITMSISASTNIVGPRSAELFALANGSQTLNFASDRDVFDVSEGVLTDFEGLNIFGNRWVDPRVPVVTPPVSAVPLPAGMPLLVAGLSAFAVLRRKPRSKMNSRNSRP